MPREASTKRPTSTLFASLVESDIALSLLALAAWSTVFLEPSWLSDWIAGFLNSAFLWSVPKACFFLLGWPVLFVLACIRFIQDLRSQQKMRMALWLSIAVGIVLAYAQLKMNQTWSSQAFFARGLLTRVDIRTDIDAVRTWLTSLDPNDCMTEGYSSEPQPWRYLSRKDQPKVLQRQGDNVRLELDAEGRPSVRLEWDQSKDGSFGLVIGHRDMKTPPSEPGMYGEKRTELRPGIYFWYEEA